MMLEMEDGSLEVKSVLWAERVHGLTKSRDAGKRAVIGEIGAWSDF